MDVRKNRLSPSQAADLLKGRLVLTSEAERRCAMSDIADMVITLAEQNEMLRERVYLLEERLAIVDEGSVIDG